jgi:alanine racemase
MSSGEAGAMESLIRAELDLDALRHNVRELRRLAAGVPILAPVKADAYGHGVQHVVPVLREEGVAAFGVANVIEGALLRSLGVTEPVLVFGDLLASRVAGYISSDLDATVGSPEAVEAACAAREPLRVHVKVDTGMHRLGLPADQVAPAIERLEGAPHVSIVGLWTHLATADEPDRSFARHQLAVFDEIRASLDRSVRVHIANSGAMVQLPETVLGRDFVRPGGLLYGLPSSETILDKVDVRPVMRLVTRVIHRQLVEAGETVSYGRTWRAPAASLIATIAAGYGDGLPRQLSNRGSVTIRGRAYPIAGRICMDMLMVDLGPPHGSGQEIRVEDEVVIFGAGGPTVLDQANCADTISYSLCTGLTQRVPRIPRQWSEVR